jgi:hypothetical protein
MEMLPDTARMAPISSSREEAEITRTKGSQAIQFGGFNGGAGIDLLETFQHPPPSGENALRHAELSPVRAQRQKKADLLRSQSL